MYASRIDNGPSGSSIQRGTLVQIPGIDIGTTDDPLKQPEFPWLAPVPGGWGSITMTFRPDR